MSSSVQIFVIADNLLARGIWSRIAYDVTKDYSCYLLNSSKR